MGGRVGSQCVGGLLLRQFFHIPEGVQHLECGYATCVCSTGRAGGREGSGADRPLLLSKTLRKQVAC